MRHRFPPESEPEPSEVLRRDLPPGIVELLAERVDLGAGDARLEAIFKDGTLRFAYLHTGALDPAELGRRFNHDE